MTKEDILKLLETLSRPAIDIAWTDANNDYEIIKQWILTK